MSAAQQPDTSAFDVEHIGVDDLASMAAPYNPRKISDHDLGALRRSLSGFGCVEPIVCNRRSNTIIGGHQRVKAAALEDIGSLPVVWVDLDEHRERALNLALNRIRGDWDDDALGEVLSFLDDADFDLELTGFEDLELARLLQKETDGATEDDAVPSNVEKRCEAGDLWELGDHVLLCGDATDAEDVGRLLAGATPQLCVTDPPYGVALDQGWRDRVCTMQRMGKTQTDRLQGDDRADWREAWDLFNGSVIYSWSAAGDPCIRAGLGLIEAGFEIRNQIIWHKTMAPMSRGAYHYKHEPCWYAVKKGHKAYWIGGRKQTSVWEAASPKHIMGGSKEEKFDHPTQKPVELFTRAIANHKGDVYEPFCGSGTGLIACEKLSRKCYALEIAPEYCDVILQRWENFTERKAERADA